MNAPEILEESPITMAELGSEVRKIKKREEEAGFRIQKTDEYLAAFSDVPKGKIDELVTRITALSIPRLKEMHIYKIADTLPQTLEQLKVVLQGYTITINQENMKKIVAAVKETVA
ncbi:hypothetical protein JXB02_04205 [Candidatus Woesearchaeota archaeon]|nr:hypothetical protein [Candidatus Woesearchaeota archaeon]